MSYQIILYYHIILNPFLGFEKANGPTIVELAIFFSVFAGVGWGEGWGGVGWGGLLTFMFTCTLS